MIKIDDVQKYYGGATRRGIRGLGQSTNVSQAVNRVSFTVEDGEFTAIMGPSGSGKTTLLNMIATIDHVTAGHIYFDGTDITEMNENQLADFRKMNLGFVFQDYNLLDTLTIEENISLTMMLRQYKKSQMVQKVSELMKRLGIESIKDKFPHEVSGGQKQRCACARAIVNEPKLILADEPTGALDSKSAQMLLETFQLMNEELGATILMVTHDVISASFCKRILFLKDGEIFYELIRGEKTRRQFLNEILDVMSLGGGEFAHAE